MKLSQSNLPRCRPFPIALGGLALAAGLLQAPALAEGPQAGSTLVFPAIRTDGGNFVTTTSVTNTNLDPARDVTLGGSITVHYQYYDFSFPAAPSIQNRTELLDPGDTLTVSASCHAFDVDGYLIVTAEDPFAINRPIAHNYLMGSQFVVRGLGAAYELSAIPLKAIPAPGDIVDVDANGEINLDGVEYEQASEFLYVDSVLASLGNRLALVSLTGDLTDTTTVVFDIWNDNQMPLSQVVPFQGWFDEKFENLSGSLSLVFLMNLPGNDPTQFDVDCDGSGDLETAWLRIRPTSTATGAGSIANPVVLGAVTGGSPGLERGRPLWRTPQTRPTGSFGY